MANNLTVKFILLNKTKPVLMVIKTKILIFPKAKKNRYPSSQSIYWNTLSQLLQCLPALHFDTLELS